MFNSQVNYPLTIPPRPLYIFNVSVNNQSHLNARRVSSIFSALADPTRRRILLALTRQPQSTVTALSKPFRISLPAISRHLRVLERARLIDRRRKGRIHFIRLRAQTLKSAQDWIAQFAGGWNFSFDALDNLLKNESTTAQSKIPTAGKNSTEEIT